MDQIVIGGDTVALFPILPPHSCCWRLPLGADFKIRHPAGPTINRHHNSSLKITGWFVAAHFNPR